MFISGDKELLTLSVGNPGKVVIPGVALVDIWAIECVELSPFYKFCVVLDLNSFYFELNTDIIIQTQ